MAPLDGSTTAAVAGRRQAAAGSSHPRTDDRMTAKTGSAREREPRGPRAEALVVEDDPLTLRALSTLVELEGFAVRRASTITEARRELERARPDVVLCDVVLPDGKGMEILTLLRDQPGTEVILITGNASVDTAIEALRLGAYDYLLKPVDEARLKTLLAGFNRHRELRQEVSALRHELRQLGRFGAMVGTSTAMQHVYDMIEKGAPSEVSILLTGESGTGKELAAAHRPRAEPPPRQAVRRRQLRSGGVELDRERAVRPREGRLHRRHSPPRRLLRAGRRRHAAARRDHRDAAGAPGQAPARARDGSPAARRRVGAGQGGRPHRGRFQSRSRAGGRIRQSARRPVLPARRVSDPNAAAARARSRPRADRDSSPGGDVRERGQGSEALPARRSTSCVSTPGPGTCASCATCCRGRSFFPTP